MDRISDLVAQHVRELGFNAWANRATWDALRAARVTPTKAIAVLAHIAGAESLWLTRLQQSDPMVKVWPAMSLADIDRELRSLAAIWRTRCQELSATELEREVSYTNSKGEHWRNRVSDILAHVTLHSSHHRGQICHFLAATGEKPPYVDYIECVRRGHLEQGWPKDLEWTAG
ncbi:MAG TPA: DinB family protein [Candidatus Udaeobacter sp.]|nr:DinB family protein [Candidatus Udaeobacter sp.]